MSLIIKRVAWNWKIIIISPPTDYPDDNKNRLNGLTLNLNNKFGQLVAL